MNSLGNSRSRNFNFEKSPPKTNFFGELSRRHVSFPRILILIISSHPSRRGSHFCCFLASDVEKITIFWESTLCEIIMFFRTCQSLYKTKFQKKLLFWENFPDIFSIMFPFPGYVFILCFLGGPFFERRKTVLFGSCALFAEHEFHIPPPTTGLNLEAAEISTSKFANSKQEMSKSIQQFLKCTLISSPLFRWKSPTQVGTLGTLCWGWELGRLQIHLWIHGPIIIPFNMTLSEWMLKVMWEECQKICRKKYQKICQKECQKLCRKKCQKISQKEYQKICQKIC